LKKILVLLPYYKPSIKAGGPVKSLCNLVGALGSEFEFLIITRDRDIGDSEAFVNVESNKWVDVGGVSVFYASPEQLVFFRVSEIIKGTAHDILYLNSFFSFEFSIKPLLAMKIGLLPKASVLLAPRGEFSSGALKLKRIKKILFIWLAKKVGLHEGVFWHGSTAFEKKDIVSTLNIAPCFVRIAKNIPASCDVIVKSDSVANGVAVNAIKIVFLSRITPKKNLDFALNVLAEVKVPVRFDIYGPKEDEGYWFRCLKLIATLPNWIRVEYKSELHPDEVSGMFQKYDLFLFPTLGENYGHVIAESMSVGTRVLISNLTPWQNLEKDNLGWSFSLGNLNDFVTVINDLKKVTFDERKYISERGRSRVVDPVDIVDNREMFLSVLRDDKEKAGVS